MPRTKTHNSKSELSRLFIVCGLIIILTGIWLWWHNVYTSPYRVFWKTIDNNLATVSVTKHVIEDDGQQTIDQYSQLHFGSQNAARNLVTITQTGANGKSQVTSESIGLLTNDYSRYIHIDSSEKSADGKPLDFTKVTGIWGKSLDAKKDSNATVYFRQAALNSVVPFGWMNSSIRQTITSFMQNKQVYNVSYDEIQRKQQNGHIIYVFPVEINAQAYVAMLQQYVNKLGLKVGDELDPSTYEGIPPIKAEFSIDVVSRQLKKIHYTASNRDEEFLSYGINSPVTIPGQTIPIEELQNRLQQLQ